MALILDGALSSMLSHPVSFDIAWISETDDNRSLEAELKECAPACEVTWFKRPPGSEESMLLTIIELIEDHYGPYGAAVPWQEMTVYGLRERGVLKRALADDDEFILDADGTTLRRRC